jgi:hypothetical protein
MLRASLEVAAARRLETLVLVGEVRQGEHGRFAVAVPP